MSYDLLVFDPSAAPKDRPSFVAWYEQQTEWGEDHSYEDPAVSTAAVRAMYLELIQKYPPLNGPFATEDVDHPRATDYSVATTLVYAAFAWSEAERARGIVFELAKKHGLGFFDASAENGGVWFPSEDGYTLMHGE